MMLITVLRIVLLFFDVEKSYQDKKDKKFVALIVHLIAFGIVAQSANIR